MFDLKRDYIKNSLDDLGIDHITRTDDTIKERPTITRGSYTEEPA